MQSALLMTWLPSLLVVAVLGLWIYGVADFARADERDIRTFPKEAWLFILLLGSFMGAVIWFAVGRPRRP